MNSKFNITNINECNKLADSILSESTDIMLDDFNSTEEEALKDRKKMVLWMIENHLPVEITDFEEAKKWILDNIFALAVEYCEETLTSSLN